MSIMLADRRLSIDVADEAMMLKLRRALTSWRCQHQEAAAFVLGQLVEHGELDPHQTTDALIQRGYYRSGERETAYRLVMSVVAAVITHGNGY